MCFVVNGRGALTALAVEKGCPNLRLARPSVFVLPGAGVTPAGVQQYRRAHNIPARPSGAVPRVKAAPEQAPVNVAARPRVVKAKPARAPAVAAASLAAEVAVMTSTEAPAAVIQPPSESAPAATRAFRVCAGSGSIERRFFVVAADIGAAAQYVVGALTGLAGGPWTTCWIRDAGDAL